MHIGKARDVLIGKRRRIALNVVSTRGGGRGKLSSQVIVSQTVRGEVGLPNEDNHVPEYALIRQCDYLKQASICSMAELTT